MEADVGDQDRFPARSVSAGGEVSPLRARHEAPLDDFLFETDTRTFVVVHQDRVVYERYFGDAGAPTLETSFSVAKSFLSTLVGIAVEEGKIGDIDDEVTDYLPSAVRSRGRPGKTGSTTTTTRSCSA